MSIRNKVISAAVVIPVLAAAPAVADETPTPDPTVTESPVPEPTTEPTPEPVVETPSPTQTAIPEPVVEVPSPAAASPAATVQAIPVAPAAKRAAAGLRTSRAGISLRTTGTRYSAMSAVSRLMSWARQNRGGYHNGCLRLADNAYGANNRVSTALRQWYRARQAGYGHTNRMPPVGAQLFWRTSNPAGHIATYVGRGRVVSNMPGGRVKLVRWSTIDRWGPYLGWAEPYYG